MSVFICVYGCVHNLSLSLMLTYFRTNVEPIDQVKSNMT